MTINAKAILCGIMAWIVAPFYTISEFFKFVFVVLTGAKKVKFRDIMDGSISSIFLAGIWVAAPFLVVFYTIIGLYMFVISKFNTFKNERED